MPTAREQLRVRLLGRTDVAMQEPRARIICLKADADIVTLLKSHSDYVAYNRINIILRIVRTSARYDPERMLKAE